jgi:mRNA interferase YafQ
MLIPFYTTQFDKDIKKIKKSGNKNIEKLADVILKLINEEKLPSKNKDHKLIGDYIDFRECHISPDWLLIYKIDGNDIFFTRTGSHTELFD